MTLARGSDAVVAPPPTSSAPVNEWVRALVPGPASPRPSALDRYHIDDFDAFLSRDGAGQTVGVALRRRGEHRFHGQRVLGWVGDVLLSRPHDPLRLVEGPYDVLTPRDVCAFGFPTSAAWAALAYQFVIACPDGDVWEDREQARLYVRALLRAERLGVVIVGVEVLPPGLDPDQVPVADRERRTLGELKRMLLEA